MRRQPWGIPAFTNGNPIMQQQPCEEPVFSEQDFAMPQPQQQQPIRARACPKQPAGQAIRQQAGSFRAPRPSTGRASNLLPPPPQQVSLTHPSLPDQSLPSLQSRLHILLIDWQDWRLASGCLASLSQTAAASSMSLSCKAYAVQLMQTCEHAGRGCWRLPGHL